MNIEDLEVGDIVRVDHQSSVTGLHIEEGLKAGVPYLVLEVFTHITSPSAYDCVRLQGIPTPCFVGPLVKDEFLTAVHRANASGSRRLKTPLKKPQKAKAHV